MSVTRQDHQRGQSVGAAPKRNSGLFSFFRWFKPSSDPDLTLTRSEEPEEPLELSRNIREHQQTRPDLLNTSSSSSNDSLSSVVSTGTVASFAFVPPSAYKPYGVATPPEKCIVPGPLTDTYKARLVQRDKRRESDKDLTLRKKYNLFFGGATRSRDPTLKLSKSASASNCTYSDYQRQRQHQSELRAKSEAVAQVEVLVEESCIPAAEDNCKSLPLMTRRTVQNGATDSEGDDTLRGNHHRRANSESSKVRKAGAFCHVKGKRRAPQPPVGGVSKSGVVVESGTMSLRRKKRLAPQPPAVALAVATTRVLNALEQAQGNRYGTIEYADADVLYNDSLRLDNGILKSAKDTEAFREAGASPLGSPKPTQSARSSAVLDAAPVSPRPWYKRTLNPGSNRDSGSSWKASIPIKNPSILTSSKYHDDYEPIDTFPEVGFCRSPKNELSFLDVEPKAQEVAGKKSKELEKRKSGLSFLTNISELDREAAEIVKQSKTNAKDDAFREEDESTDLPPFMRPKAEHMRINSNDSWISPKRRSARDLIAKFNAITNVTKVTVNSAFFSSSSSSSKDVTTAQAAAVSKDSQIRREFFVGKKSTSVDESARILEQKAKVVSKYFGPSASKGGGAPKLSKSESSSVVPQLEKQKSEPPTAPATPKLDRKSWYCPKCSVENEYWRIICHVCSTIKPYFDDLTVPPLLSLNAVKNNSLEKSASKKSPIVATASKPTPMPTSLIRDGDATTASGSSSTKFNNTARGVSSAMAASSNNKLKSANEDELFERVLQRSKTQIGFPVKSNIFGGNERKKTPEAPQAQEKDKKEEREKLKKMLIEMKNSLPKRKLSNGKPIGSTNANRASAIQEDPVQSPVASLEKEPEPEIEPEPPEKVAEITLVSTETIYENVRMKRTENPKPLKVSSSSQTSAQSLKKIAYLGASGKPPDAAIISTSNSKQEQNTFQLIRAKDFLGMNTASGSDKVEAHIYANLNDASGTAPGSVAGSASGKPEVHQAQPGFFLDMAKRLEKENSAAGNTDTLEINRLLRRLETAISKGELGEASVLARDLAQLKVNCSVVRQKSIEKNVGEVGSGTQGSTFFTADMYVEDRVTHRGPFPIQVHGKQTVQDLKIQVEKEFQIPLGVQRWILGKQLASDDAATLQDHSVTSNGCPIFLYLVAPPSNNDLKLEPTADQTKKPEPPIISEETPAAALPQTSFQPDPILQKALVEVPNVENAPKLATQVAPVREQAVIQTQPVVVLNAAVPVPKIRHLALERKEDLKQPLQEAPAALRLQENAPSNALHPEPAPRLAKQAPLAAAENLTPEVLTPEAQDYDNNTLKATAQPQAVQQIRNLDWECEVCTLLNPLSSNICAVCATIRKVSPQMQLQQQKQVLQQQKLLVQSQNNVPHAQRPARTAHAKAAAPAAPGHGSKDQKASDAKDNEAHYRQLVDLDNRDMVRNVEPFECIVCMTECLVGEGVTLRECLHQFCRTCLAHTVEFCEEAEVKCPYRDDQYACDIALQDREVKALVTKVVYEQHLAKSVAQAENKTERSFHCKTPDCRGWCIFEDNVNEFRCPVCRKTNCLTCQAIHMGVNCKEYQERMKEHSNTDIEAKKTREMLDEMVSKGEALKCPTCQVVLMKKWGCDWLRCSMCKTEICWVTRGPRWGPAGKGDISGGCQCGVNGIKCHPQCNYCH